MAAHVRKQIREAVATAVTGLSTTSTRVYQSRVYPLEDANLPALLVLTSSEQAEAVSIHAPQTLERRLRVEVSGIAKAVADLDDTLDQICKEVEIALSPPVTALGALAKSIVLVGTEIEMQGTAERPVGLARLTFEVVYYTTSSAPDVAL